MMLNGIRLASVVALCLVFAASACKKKEDETPKETAVAEEKEADKKEEQAEEEQGAEEPPPAHSSEVPGTQNQLDWDQDVPEVSFAVTKPKDGATVKSGDEVEVAFELKNYRTGRTIGQHVHVIVDNEPYIAHYNAAEPLVLEDLEPGTHTIRAFPARHYHLALKKGDVFETLTFHVEKKSKKYGFDAEKPYLTYSRPKGSYSAEAGKSILLDFYVSNVELGDDAKVVYTVDGESKELTEWKPVLLPPLSPGEHEVNLKLVDGDGKVIENGGFNDPTRTIKVTE